MKPTGKAQGKGIFLSTRCSRQRRRTRLWRTRTTARVRRGRGVRRLAVRGRPVTHRRLWFDLRLYVGSRGSAAPRVRQPAGLRALLRRQDVSPRSESGDLGDHYAHLTNVAVQKKNAQYNKEHGGKWSLENLRLFLESARGAEAVSKLWRELDAVILKSLRAVQNVMHNDAHCFELYGYDILIDDALRAMAHRGERVAVAVRHDGGRPRREARRDQRRARRGGAGESAFAAAGSGASGSGKRKRRDYQRGVAGSACGRRRGRGGARPREREERPRRQPLGARAEQVKRLLRSPPKVRSSAVHAARLFRSSASPRSSVRCGARRSLV